MFTNSLNLFQKVYSFKLDALNYENQENKMQNLLYDSKTR